MTEENYYDLTTSSKALGKLYPILKDKQGNIIDGFHRQNADPDWPAITVDLVDNPVKLELARLAVNFCRRIIPATEIQQRVTFLIKNGMKPQEIADNTGISVSTIYRHMPQELKDKAISEGTSIARSVKSEVLREGLSSEKSTFAECQRCHIQTLEPKTWHGHNLCARCEEKANFNPEAYDGYFRTLEREKAKLVPQTRVPAFKETAEFRKARMKPGISEMDKTMLVKLQNSSELRDLGWNVQFQKEYLRVVCRSDLTLYRDDQEVMCFWDGSEVHKHPEKDDANREIAKADQEANGIRAEVFARAYKSPAEADQVLIEVLEFLREYAKWSEKPRANEEETET